MDEFAMHNLDAELGELSDQDLLARYEDVKDDVDARVAIMAEMARRAGAWKRIYN